MNVVHCTYLQYAFDEMQRNLSRYRSCNIGLLSSLFKSVVTARLERQDSDTGDQHHAAASVHSTAPEHSRFILFGCLVAHGKIAIKEYKARDKERLKC